MCMWYFAFYYSYWCKFLQKYAISKLTNGTRAYDRIVLPDAKRTKTVSNVQSEVIKVLNSGKNKNSYTTYWSCITILSSHIPKSLYPKKKKLRKRAKQKCIDVFFTLKVLRVQSTWNNVSILPKGIQKRTIFISRY